MYFVAPYLDKLLQVRQPTLLPSMASSPRQISAGTTPERVAETLERIDAVLEAFDDGPTDEEVGRIAVGLRSGGLMQQEHGPSRARQLALDVFRRGAARSTEAILSEFDAIDADDVRRVASERMGPTWRSAAVSKA